MMKMDFEDATCSTPERKAPPKMVPVNVSTPCATPGNQTCATPGDLSIYNQSYFEDDYWLTFSASKENERDVDNNTRRANSSKRNLFNNLDASIEDDFNIDEYLSRSFPPYTSKLDGLSFQKMKDATSTTRAHSSLPENLNHHCEIPPTEISPEAWSVAQEYVNEKLFQLSTSDATLGTDPNGEDQEHSKRSLTDEEIQSLPPIHPSAQSLNLVFEITLDASQLGEQLANLEGDPGLPISREQNNIEVNNITSGDANTVQEQTQHQSVLNNEAQVVNDVQPGASSLKQPGLMRLPSVESGYSSNPHSPPDTGDSEAVFNTQPQIFLFPPQAPQKCDLKNPDSTPVSKRAHNYETSTRDTHSKPPSPPLLKSVRKCLRPRFENDIHERVLCPVPEVLNECSSSGSTTDPLVALTPEKSILKNEEHNLVESFDRADGKISKSRIEKFQRGNGVTIDGVISMYNQCFTSPITKLPEPLSTSSPLPPPQTNRKQNVETPRSRLQQNKSITEYDEVASSSSLSEDHGRSINKSGRVSPNSTSSHSKRRRRYRASVVKQSSKSTPTQQTHSPSINVITPVTLFDKQTSNLSINPANVAHEPLSSTDNEDELPTRSSPKSRDYVTLKTVADDIFERIKIPFTEGVLDRAKLIEHLHQRYMFKIRLLFVDPATPETSDGQTDIAASPSMKRKTKYKRYTNISIYDFRCAKRTHFNSFDFESLKIETCMSELLDSLLAQNNDAVNRCCNYIFRNLHYVSRSSEFLTAAPEIILMILSNPQGVVLGPHGFPLAYQSSEREVLETVKRYIKHNNLKRSTKAKLRDTLLSVVDPEIASKHSKNTSNRSSRNASRVGQHGNNRSLCDNKPCRQRHLVTYDWSRPAITATGSREEYLLLPTLSTISTPSHRCGNEKYSSYRNAEPKTNSHVDFSDSPSSTRFAHRNAKESAGTRRPDASQSTSAENKHRVDKNNTLNKEKPIDTLQADEVCDNSFTLRRIYIASARRQGVPYITGLGLEYACHGYREYVALGSCTEGKDYRVMAKLPLRLADVSSDRPFGSKRDAKSIYHPGSGPVGMPKQPLWNDELVTDSNTFVGSLKLESGEHVTGVNVQGLAVLHNIEFETNTGRRIQAHSHMHPAGSMSSSTTWTSLSGPPSVQGSGNSGLFCLQTISADVKEVDSTPQFYMKNLKAAWAVFKYADTDGPPEGSVNTISDSTTISQGKPVYEKGSKSSLATSNASCESKPSTPPLRPKLKPIFNKSDFGYFQNTSPSSATFRDQEMIQADDRRGNVSRKRNM